MKLTRKKLIELIDLKNRGWTSYQIKKKIDISVERIHQVYNKYLKTGEIPEIGKNIGRPEKLITEKERIIVKRVYEKYNVCASQLKLLIERDFNLKYSCYHIHKIMLIVKDVYNSPLTP